MGKHKSNCAVFAPTLDGYSLHCTCGADANKKVQSSPALAKSRGGAGNPGPHPQPVHGSECARWRNLDASGPCTCGVERPSPAPLPELSDRATLRARLDGFADPVDAAITIIVSHEATLEDLTRRLAEAEECLTIAHMDGYHEGRKAADEEGNVLRHLEHENAALRVRAEAAEARNAEQSSIIEGLLTDGESASEALNTA